MGIFDSIIRYVEGLSPGIKLISLLLLLIAIVMVFVFAGL